MGIDFETTKKIATKLAGYLATATPVESPAPEPAAAPSEGTKRSTDQEDKKLEAEDLLGHLDKDKTYTAGELQALLVGLEFKTVSGRKKKAKT